jgi:hypothetical protein
VANFTVQQTFDDPASVAAPNWQPSSITALVGASTIQQGAYTLAPLALRVLFNSGAGSLTATFLQPGGTP